MNLNDEWAEWLSVAAVAAAALSFLFYRISRFYFEARKLRCAEWLIVLLLCALVIGFGFGIHHLQVRQ